MIFSLLTVISLFLIFIQINCKNEIEEKTEKRAVDLAIQFPTKMILRPMVFTETTCQRES